MSQTTASVSSPLLEAPATKPYAGSAGGAGVAARRSVDAGTARARREKATVKGVYEQIAAAYDERIPGITLVDERFAETELDFILSRVKATDDVLDMGCGTGRFTIPIGQQAGTVTGLDLSPAMLAQARAKAERAGVHATFREGDMEHLPFEDRSFDVVTSMLALMHIPLESRQGVFVEASRVLRPGGHMIVGVKNSLFERLCHADRFASVDITDVESKELIFTNTHAGEDLKAPWYSFSPQDLNTLFAIAGLSPVGLKGNIPFFAWVADSVVDAPGAYTMLRQLETLLGDVPPFNYFGYHILADAVKPKR